MTEHIDIAVAQRAYDNVVESAAALEQERLTLVHEHHRVRPQTRGAEVAMAICEREKRIARLAAIDQQRSRLNADLNLARRRLHSARSAASREICAAIKPDYVRAVKTLAVALQAAQDAHATLVAISEPINADGVQWHDLVPMAAPQTFERVDGWLKGAKAAGYLE